MEAWFMIVPLGQPRNFVLLLMLMQIMFALLLGVHAVLEWKSILSEEENLEMERQLKVINKPPIKSFRTDYGDILDCIDIYKQHAFDYPLLKDHKVQMRPKRISKGMMGGISPRFLPKNIKCPPGSVLIRRTTKEDLIMAKKIKALGLNYPTSFHFHSTNAAAPPPFSHNYGAKRIMNVRNPSVSPNQLSSANLWIANGPLAAINVIKAGWGVQPRLYSSNYTRLSTYWTADGYIKTGCHDYLCPGFVQVSSDISLGLVLNQISTYNGTQQDIEIAIILDEDSWWLKFFNKFIGYGPNKLFSYKYGGANFVVWGGQVYSPANEASPAMGSDHDRKSGYFKQTQIWDNVNFVYPDSKDLQVFTSRPHCHGADITPEDVPPNPMDLFYGGPGQCKL